VQELRNGIMAQHGTLQRGRREMEQEKVRQAFLKEKRREKGNLFWGVEEGSQSRASTASVTKYIRGEVSPPG